MNVKWLAIALCIGCQGESVSPTSVDAGNDASADTASNPLCAVPKNLVTNGNFTAGLSGWDPSAANVTFVDGGPCGRAAHIRTTTWGSITRTGMLAFKKGQTLRLRAYFRTIKRSTGSAPVVTMRLYREVDGGAPDEIGAAASDSPDWNLAETTATIANDADTYDLFVASRTAADDEFEVTAVSATVE